MEKKYKKIVDHYEACLEKFGDTYQGVDWPNEPDALKRYQVMLEISDFDFKKRRATSLLDFGCGTGHLYEYMVSRKIDGLQYSGLDLSEKFVECCNHKFPELKFYRVDILDANDLPSHDYVIMNGVFTEKRELSYAEMLSYFKKVIRAVFQKANIGAAFNVMSKQVDWEREDLFHLPLDELSLFLTKEISRNFIIRSDYGLYEYTVYIYK